MRYPTRGYQCDSPSTLLLRRPQEIQITYRKEDAYGKAENRSRLTRKVISGFGWAKTVGRMRQVMVRGLQKVDQMFVLNMAAYNLVRMRSLGQVRP